VTGASKIAVPLLAARDVIPHLGKPGHWKQGRSARSLAESWFGAAGLPAAIAGLLATAPDWRRAQLVNAWLERKTDLEDDAGAPSQTDLLAVLDLGDELGILAVEAKVDESFGDYVHQWIAGASPGKSRRLKSLCERLNITAEAAMPLRYQLLHRTAATVLEARRFHARKAVLAVQSFCPDATGHGDFAQFCAALGFENVEQRSLAGPRPLAGVDLWVGWTTESPSGGIAASTAGPLQGRCACAAVRVDLARRPEWVNQCDCSVCLRVGAAWGYFHLADVTITGPTTGFVRADWAEPTIAFHFCAACGSSTHWAAFPGGPADRTAINMRLFEPADLEGLEVRFSDGLRRAEGEPRLPERHPRLVIHERWPT
jgi:hypothetical protein